VTPVSKNVDLVQGSTAGGTEITGTTFSWVSNTKYLMRLDRAGTAFSCNGAGNIATGSATIAANGETGVWLGFASARFEYIYIVESP
jgi:hypothetical protein